MGSKNWSLLAGGLLVGSSNDNDNDTLREVPHQSNESLALQARVSDHGPSKKNLFY